MTNYRQKDTSTQAEGNTCTTGKKKRRRVASLCLQKIFFKKQQKEDFKKSKKILTFSISNVMYNSAHFIFFIS